MHCPWSPGSPHHVNLAPHVLSRTNTLLLRRVAFFNSEPPCDGEPRRNTRNTSVMRFKSRKRVFLLHHRSQGICLSSSELAHTKNPINTVFNDFCIIYKIWDSKIPNTTWLLGPCVRELSLLPEPPINDNDRRLLPMPRIPDPYPASAPISATGQRRAGRRGDGRALDRASWPSTFLREREALPTPARDTPVTHRLSLVGQTQRRHPLHPKAPLHRCLKSGAWVWDNAVFRSIPFM